MLLGALPFTFLFCCKELCSSSSGSVSYRRIIITFAVSMQDGMRFWPYTYMDCHISSVFRERIEWCIGSNDEPAVNGVQRNGKCEFGWDRYGHNLGALDERAKTNTAGFAANSVQ